jgi:hypothetical protein
MRTPREQALAQTNDENPIYVDGRFVWLAHEFTLGLMGDRVYKENRNRKRKIGCDLHWRMNLKPLPELLDENLKPPLAPGGEGNG